MIVKSSKLKVQSYSSKCSASLKISSPKVNKFKVIKFINFGLLILILHFALCTLHLSEANAQNSRSFTISPPSLRFTLQPGQKTEKIIKITNRSEETLEFIADTIDFIVTDKKGTPELLPTGTLIENQYAASTWSTVLPDKIIVKPGKTELATVYLQVPGDARPGGRYFAVTLKPVTGPGPEGSGAAVNSVVGSLVYLTVAGKTKESARVVSFFTPKLSEYGPIKLTTEIRNQGDIHVTPKATVEIKNLFGKKAYSYALANINIFPGTSRIYEDSWERHWLFGRYTANLSGYYGQAENLPLAALTIFWVIPYKLITIILLASAIAVIALLYLRKKEEKEVEE